MTLIAVFDDLITGNCTNIAKAELYRSAPRAHIVVRSVVGTKGGNELSVVLASNRSSTHELLSWAASQRLTRWVEARGRTVLHSSYARWISQSNMKDQMPYWDVELDGRPVGTEYQDKADGEVHCGYSLRCG